MCLTLALAIDTHAEEFAVGEESFVAYLAKLASHSLLYQVSNASGAGNLLSIIQLVPALAWIICCLLGF